MDRYAKRALGYYQDNNYQIFNIRKACESLSAEGVMECFANSFLAEADTGRSFWDKQVKYVKLNQDRDERFQIATELGETATGMKYACKFALSESAKEHIRKMALCNAADSDRMEGLQGYYTEESGRLIYPYIEGISVNDEIREILTNKEFTEEDKAVRIIYILKHFVNCCREHSVYTEDFATDAFKSVFGTEIYETGCRCMNPANVDLIFDNLFYIESKYVIIDQEWMFDFPVPVDFVIWRAISECLKRNPLITFLPGGQNIWQECGFNDARRVECFRSWEEHFVADYVKADRAKGWCQPTLTFDFYNEAKRLWKERTIVELFCLVGRDFTEDNKIAVEAEVVNGEFQVVFSLKDVSSTKFRLDVADKACSC